MRRRTFVASALGIGSATTAGCVGFLTGSDPAEFEASPVGVAADALDATRYEPTAVEPMVIEREFEVAGQTRAVEVTNYQSGYEKSIDMGPLGEQRGAVFTVLSTPRVSVLDREFNPVADMSTVELADMVQQNYDGVRNVEHDRDGDVTILGESTTQSRFAAEADFDGTPVDIYLHLSEAVEAGENLVVGVGGYPRVADGESENVLTLMEGVDPDAVSE